METQSIPADEDAPNANFKTQGHGQGQSPTKGQKRKVALPSPQELISHYESQGMDSKEASIMVIEDLQKALFGAITSRRGKKDRSVVESSRKIDALNSRLVILDMKMDSKPGYVETFAIGIASGATLKGIGAVLPHVCGALANIWKSLTSITNSQASNS